MGNHSFRHEPWLHLFSEEEIENELAATEDRLRDLTGRRPLGFRGPGFSLSPTVIRVLARRGYLYDATTLPTFLGPLARAYYFLSARLSGAERTQRKLLFGRVWEGCRPLGPHWWRVGRSPRAGDTGHHHAGRQGADARELPDVSRAVFG